MERINNVQGLVTFTVFTSLGSVTFLTVDRLIFVILPMKYNANVTLIRTLFLVVLTLALCASAAVIYAIHGNF